MCLVGGMAEQPDAAAVRRMARAESRVLLQQETEAGGAAVFIGTVGRFVHEEDEATFLAILATVRKVRRDIYGVVVGNGKLRSSVEALAQELDLGGAVTFLGERADARRLTAGFDLFVLTSCTEGFRNVLLDATLMGVPCVAANVVGHREVLGHPESLFPPGDVERAAALVLAALADMPRTIQRTEEIRGRALERSEERSGNAWLQLYGRDIAARSTHSSAPAAGAILEVQGTR
jgi:glycosyltransferase involved in cell wall biosynthesis